MPSSSAFSCTILSPVQCARCKPIQHRKTTTRTWNTARTGARHTLFMKSSFSINVSVQGLDQPRLGHVKVAPADTAPTHRNIRGLRHLLHAEPVRNAMSTTISYSSTVAWLDAAAACRLALDSSTARRSCAAYARSSLNFWALWRRMHPIPHSHSKAAGIP